MVFVLLSDIPVCYSYSLNREHFKKNIIPLKGFASELTERYKGRNSELPGPSVERIFHSYRQMFCADVHVIFATESFAKIKKTMK